MKSYIYASLGLPEKISRKTCAKLEVYLSGLFPIAFDLYKYDLRLLASLAGVRARGAIMNTILKSFVIFAVVTVLAGQSATQTKQVAISNEKVIEIVTRGIGVVYPANRDVLDFRLYEDRSIEWEFVPTQSGAGTNATSEIRLVKSSIRASEVLELIELARDPEFPNTKKRFPSLRPHVDDYWFTKVSFEYKGEAKSLVVTNFWDIVEYPEDRAKYPRPLVGLLERVEELKKSASITQ